MAIDKTDKPFECMKLPYSDKDSAEDGLEQIKVLNMSKGREKRNKWLHTYHCNLCQKWHVGHINPERRRKKNGKGVKTEETHQIPERITIRAFGSHVQFSLMFDDGKAVSERITGHRMGASIDGDILDHPDIDDGLRQALESLEESLILAMKRLADAQGYEPPDQD